MAAGLADWRRRHILSGTLTRPARTSRSTKRTGNWAAGSFSPAVAASGYNLPGSVFDKEFRCAFDLLAAIPTADNPKISVKDQFFTFNNDHPFNDKTHIVDRDLKVVHGPHFGLSPLDGLALSRVSLTPEVDAGRAADR